jgi:hypothetical protein
MPSGKRFWIAAVMLLLCWSPSAIAMDQLRVQEHTGKPSARSAVTQERANTPQEPSLRCLSPNGGKCLRQTPVDAQPSSVVNYNGLRHVKCPAPEDDQPIVSVVVAMALP